MLNQLFMWFGKPVELNNYISFNIGSRMEVPNINKFIVWKSEGKIIYSNAFFYEAYNTHQISTYTNYQKLFEEMKRRYPILQSESYQNFKNECQDNFPKIKSFIESFHQSINEPIAPDLSEKKAKKESNYMHMWKEGNQNNIEGQWSEKSTNDFIKYLTDGAKSGNIFIKNSHNDRIDWEKISRDFNRKGASCYDKYIALRRKNLISDLKIIYEESTEKNESSYVYNPKFYKIFTKDEEIKILNYILSFIDKGKLVTTYDLAKYAYASYYSPENLASKAVINKCLKKKKKVFSKDGEIIIPNYKKKVYSLIDEADNDPESFIKKYDLQIFKVSRFWIHSFMQRHNLSFRTPHSEKRTDVRDDDVDIYLNLIATAILRYGVRRVINMDETRVNTFSPQRKTIAPKGIETIKIRDDGKNLKEGTTYIGTTSMDADVRFPLVVVAKGSTTVCEQKYITDYSNEDHVLHSDNGWSTSESMINYLDWLFERMGGRPFALILDMYPSHCDPSVKEHANDLKIELIYVPAGATGLMQPLDRRVFGVLKEQIKKDEKTTVVSTDISRYGQVHDLASKNFKNISKKCIESAWNIPGLNDYLPENEDSKSESEYIDSEEASE